MSLATRTGTLTAAQAQNFDFSVDQYRQVSLVISNTGATNAVGTTVVSVSPDGTYFGDLTPITTAVGSLATSTSSGLITLPVAAKTLRVTLTSSSGSTIAIALWGSKDPAPDSAIRVAGNVVGAVSAGALSVTTLTASSLTATRVPFASTAGLLVDDADLTFATDTLSATKVASSSLTSGRVTFASTSGLLVDDSDLTFSGSTLTATNAVVTTALTQGASGSMAAGSGGISTTGDVDAVGGFRTLVGPFVQTNVAANQASVQIALGATGTVHLDVAMPRAGSLVGVTASFTVAPAGANLIVKVFKNGSLIDAAGILTVTPGATLGRAATFTKDTSGMTFAAGDRIGIAVLTDGSWTATTSDITAYAWVEC